MVPATLSARSAPLRPAPAPAPAAHPSQIAPGLRPVPEADQTPPAAGEWSEESDQLAPVTPLHDGLRAARARPSPDPRPDRAEDRARDPRRGLGRVAFDSSESDDLPPPDARVIQKLALYAFEVLEGARSATQLGTWILPDVAAQLTERRARRVEQRTLCKDSRRVISVPGPVHIGRPAPDVVEATVVLHAEPRSTPVALRFEYLRERWRVTELTVL